MKTKIFEVSGLKLIRIRPKNNESPNIEQFIKAIEDIKEDEKVFKLYFWLLLRIQM